MIMIIRKNEDGLRMWVEHAIRVEDEYSYQKKVRQVRLGVQGRHN
jgi:hypothetical protein